MKSSEIESFLNGAVKPHMLELGGIWRKKLQGAREGYVGDHPADMVGKIIDIFLIEYESRVADTKRLLTSYARSDELADCSDTDIIDHACAVLLDRSVDIKAAICNEFDECLKGRSLADNTHEFRKRLDATHAMSVLWHRIELSEVIQKDLVQQRVLNATLESALASQRSARATESSAIASVKMTKVAKWSAVFTAIGALGTMIAAFATAYGTWHPDHSMDKVLNQQVPHQSAIDVSKP